MKIGIFGGTFNPIHYGHLRAAEEIREVIRLDRIVFIPSARPPHKAHVLGLSDDSRTSGPQQPIDAIHRYEMTLIAARGNPAFEVSDIEIKRNGPSYSIDTVREFSRLYPDVEIFFIVGIDAFLDVPNWREPEELISSTNFIVISRPPHMFRELEASPYIKDISFADLDKGDTTSICGITSGGRSICLFRITALDISASRIRNLIAEGRSVKYLLPEDVESYIIANRLYR